MTDMDQYGGSGHGGTGIDVATPPTGSTSTGSTGDTKEQAKQAAGTAAAEGKHVTAVAGEEAQRVAAEARQQTQALLDEARNQLEEQSRTQRDRLVQTLGTLGQDLDRMSEQADSGLAFDLVQQAAQRVRDISSRIDGREPRELLDDVRTFARRRPGTFLLGALAAGVVAGRVARGAQKAQSAGGGSTGPATSATGMPQQRSAEMGYGSGLATDLGPETGDPTATASLPATPSSPAAATFPPDRPGQIS